MKYAVIFELSVKEPSFTEMSAKKDEHGLADLNSWIRNCHEVQRWDSLPGVGYRSIAKETAYSIGVAKTKYRRCNRL